MSAGRAVTDVDIARIPGWFDRPDIDLFRVMLETTADLGGDLAELGVYVGRSAILLGSELADGETLTVIDTFGADGVDEANQRENEDQYGTLTRAQFEANYLALLPELPNVVQGWSSEILSHATAGTHRLVHVDASHLYAHVVGDIEAARELLKPGGVVVLDDYRSPHTPGVAAAAWRAVADGLRPFALTKQKMYATWADPEHYFDAVAVWLRDGGRTFRSEVQTIGDDQVHRLWRAPGRDRFVPPAMLPTVVGLRNRLRRSR